MRGWPFPPCVPYRPRPPPADYRETDSPGCRPQTHLDVWPSPQLCRRSPCDEFRFEIKFDGTASAIENKDGFLKAIRELKPAHLQETLIEMTSLPSTLYVGTAIGSYKQEVICNVNI